MDNHILDKLKSELTPTKLETDSDHDRYTINNRAGKHVLIHKAPFIFTCDENDKVKVLQDHSIIIKNDEIIDVVNSKSTNTNSFDIIYDAEKRGGTVITPGFINTHSHPPMYLMRSAMMLDEGEGIDETIKAMPKWECSMNDEQFTISTIGDITEQQKYGITSLMSHYGVLQPIDNATRLTRQNVINAVSAVCIKTPANVPMALSPATNESAIEVPKAPNPCCIDPIN